MALEILNRQRKIRLDVRALQPLLEDAMRRAGVADREAVLAVACELGTKTSHAAILAHSIGIPAVVGIHDVLERVRTGDMETLYARFERDDRPEAGPAGPSRTRSPSRSSTASR